MNVKGLARGRWLWPALLAALAMGCTGSSGQSGSAFVFLSVVRFSLNGTTPVAVVNSALQQNGVPTQACVTLRNDPKSPLTTPNVLDNVVVRSYTVTFARFDGGEAPGPFSFDTSVTVPSEGEVSFPVVLVPAQAKRESPLRPFPPLPLSATATILFRGRDGRGQGVDVDGAVTVVFQAGGGPDDPEPCA